MRNHYTDDFKAAALAALDANGGPDRPGAITLTAKQLGVKRNTFLRWVDRAEFIKNSVISTDKDDAIAQLRAQKKGLLTDELRTTAFVLLSLGDDVVFHIKNKIPQMSADELVRTLRAIGVYTGISIDKVARLEATGAGVGERDYSEPEADPFFGRAFPVNRKTHDA